MGDFNVFPDSQEVKPLAEGGWELVQSHTIDNIYVLSQNAWSKTDVNIKDTGISDHKPIDAIISFFDYPNIAWLKSVSITELDLDNEAVTIENNGNVNINMSGWELTESNGNKTFIFPSGFILEKGAAVQIMSGKNAAGNGKTTLLWSTDEIWASGDTCCLYDNLGRIVSDNTP